MLQLIIISIILIGIAVLGIAVKMFFIKGGQFTKTCGSVDAAGNKVSCTCKSSGEEKCENYEEHHSNDKY